MTVMWMEYVCDVVACRMCFVIDGMCRWGLCKTCVDVFFFQAEDGIRDLVRSRGLGDVYKRQSQRFFNELTFRKSRCKFF